MTTQMKIHEHVVFPRAPVPVVFVTELQHTVSWSLLPPETSWVEADIYMSRNF
jgi:hypothetical protein